MKKLILNILFSSSALILFGQPSNQNPIDKFEQNNLKKNKVRACFIGYYDFIDGKEVIKKDYDSLYYDEKGNLVTCIWAFEIASRNFYRYVEQYRYTTRIK